VVIRGSSHEGAVDEQGTAIRHGSIHSRRDERAQRHAKLFEHVAQLEQVDGFDLAVGRSRP
jgi:hypothetical protein